MDNETRQPRPGLRGHIQDRIPAFLSTLVGGLVAMGVNAPLTSPDDLVGNAGSVAVVSLIGAVIAGIIWARLRAPNLGGNRGGSHRVRRRHIERHSLHHPSRRCNHNIHQRIDASIRALERLVRNYLGCAVVSDCDAGGRILVDLKRIRFHRAAQLDASTASCLILSTSTPRASRLLASQLLHLAGLAKLESIKREYLSEGV